MSEPKSFLDVTLAWKRWIARATIAATLAAVVVSLLLPRWYTAHAVLRPPDDSDVGGGLLQLVTQFGGGLGGGRARGLMNRGGETDLALGVLKSHRIRGQVVDRFDLVNEFDSKSREHAIKELGEHLDVNTTPEGLIDVAVEAKHPEAAADWANAFAEFLDQYNRATSVEDAKRTVEFVETCLEQNRQRMETASTALREFQEKRGAVELGEQTRATVEALAELEAERTELEIQRGVLSNYTTPDQLQMVDIEARIHEIDQKGRSLRDKTASGKTKRSDTALLALGDLPSLALEFAHLKREVLVQEKVYEFLTSQLEEARIRESRDLRTVKILDEAFPPIRKSRPRRSLIVVLTAGLSFSLALSLAFAAEALLSGRGSADPEDPWARRLLNAARKFRRWGGPTDSAL